MLERAVVRLMIILLISTTMNILLTSLSIVTTLPPTDNSELFVFLAFDKVGSTSIRQQIFKSIGKHACDPYFEGDVCFSDVSNHYVNACDVV